MDTLDEERMTSFKAMVGNDGWISNDLYLFDVSPRCMFVTKNVHLGGQICDTTEGRLDRSLGSESQRVLWFLGGADVIFIHVFVRITLPNMVTFNVTFVNNLPIEHDGDNLVFIDIDTFTAVCVREEDIKHQTAYMLKDPSGDGPRRHILTTNTLG
jgi:hypothetical protein